MAKRYGWSLPIPARSASPFDRKTMLATTAFVALVGCGLFSFTNPVQAEPQGGVVVGGQATITTPAKGTTNINQSSQRAVIDWQSFSIKSGEQVNFNQPGANSIALNRVIGGDPSTIAGQLNANGQVILVNPSGVTFANGAQVNVNSLIATTANVSDPQKFMTGGKVQFDVASPNANARIVNNGQITVREGGLVALVGPSAANNGVINARLGKVTIGGAETATLDINGDGLFSFQLGKPVSQTPRDANGKALPLASNTGTIKADGGVVKITARAARDVVDSVVNVQGVVQAQAVSNEGGVVVFGGPEVATTTVGAKVDVSGAGASQKGGKVAVTGQNVTIQKTAQINASGGAGGGKIAVGGNKQGKGPLPNAKTTMVEQGATLKADATTKGDGGQVIVWSDNNTVFGGLITAQGGPQGGDGGFVETSGHALTIQPSALVSASAASGKGGSWLLDPNNLTITDNGTANTNVAGVGTGTVTTTDDSATVKASTLVAVLNGGTDVTLQTTSSGANTQAGNITVATGVTWSTSSKLTLLANNNISIDGQIDGTNGALALTATAGTITQSAAVNVTTLTFSAGGAVTLNNTGNTVSNVSGTASGAISFKSNTNLTIAAAGLTSGAATSLAVETLNSANLTVTGNVSGTGTSLNADGSLGGNGAVSGGTGAVSLRANGSSGINLSGAITGTSLAVQADSGGVTLSSVNNVFNSFTAIGGAIGGAVSVTHKGSLSVAALDVGSKTARFTTLAGGDFTLAGELDATGGAILSVAGTLFLNAKIVATGADVTLTGVTAITQAAAGVINANGLALVSGGTVDLSQATSSITTFAANVGSLAFLESNGFSIGTVSALNGITATGTVQLKAGGAISQTKGITASSLAVRTTAGDVNLTTVSNDIGTLAASSAGSLGLLETNAISIGSVGAVGALGALDGITANGVSIKAGGTVSQTRAITAGADGLAVRTTSGDINLGTTTNATSAVAFDSAGNVSYQTSSDMNLTSVAAVGSLAALDGATAVSSVTLQTTGAATVIAQNKAIVGTTLDVTTGAGGMVTLTSSGNKFSAVQSAGGIGSGTHRIVDSDGGLNVGAITSTGDLAITTAGGDLTVVGTVNLGAKTLALKVASDNLITATTAGTGVVAGTLTLETGTAGRVNIDTNINNVGTVQTAGGGVGTGGLTYRQSQSGLAVGAITSTGDVSVSETGNNASVTVSGAITATGKLVTISANTGTALVNVNAPITATDVALIARSGITQQNSGAAITVNTLRGQTTDGDVSLAPTVDANSVGTFAGFSTNGNVTFRNAGAFTVGKVNLTSGISAAGSVTLQVNNSGEAINQAAGDDGAIIATTLNLTTNNGSVSINSNKNNIAGLGTVSLGSGAFTFAIGRAGGFNVGAVAANGGIDITNTAGDLTTSAAITSDGDISLRSTTGSLTLGGAVTSNAKGITLRSSSALNTGAFAVTATTAVTGDVSLISDASTVTIGAGGVFVGDTLTIQVGPGQTLTIGAGGIAAPSVALIADQIDILGTVTATAGGTITLAPVTAGTTVTLGDHSTPAGLIIDNTELSRLTSAGTLTIGKTTTDGTTTAGAIQIGLATVGNSTLNLFSNAGVSQSNVMSVGGGTGTVNIMAGGTVALGLTGVSAGKLSGSTTSGDFLFFQNGGSGTLQVNDITTAGGQIIVRSFSNDVTLTGNLASNGGFVGLGTNVGTSAILTINGSIDAGTGTVFLFSRDGTTQGAGSVISAADFQSQNFSTGSVSLTGSNVISGNIRLDNGGGAVSFTNTIGFNLGGIPDFASAIGNFSASGFGIRTASASSATLTVGGNVTQGGTGTDTISAGTLSAVRLGAANPTVTLGNPNNTITSLGTVTLGTGSLTLGDTGGITIAGAATAGGGYSVTTDNGALTQNAGATINTSGSNGTIALTTLNSSNTFGGFAITLSDNVNAGTGTVSLTGSGAVTQNAGAITANSVSAKGGGFTGSVTLNSATNAFAAISGSAAGFGSFSATTTKSLTVNAVSTVSASISLTTTGATSDLSVNDPINAGNGSAVTLTAGRNISQTATGGVTAGGLQLNATSGTVDLTTGAVNNAVTTLAGQSNGNFLFTQAGTLSIGTVSTAGITSTAGDVTVSVTTGGLTVSTAVQGKNTVSLTGKDAVAVNGTATSTNGTVAVESTNSTLSTTAALQGNGDVTLTSVGALSIGAGVTSTAGNVGATSSAGTLGVTGNIDASASGKSVTLQSSGDLTISGVAAITANSTNGLVSLTSTAGSVLELGSSAIRSAALLASAQNDVDLRQTNNVAGTKGFAAKATTGAVMFFNSGAIMLDQVGGVSGVTAGTSVTLATATTGDVTQTAAGIITAGSGLLLQAIDGKIVLGQANQVTGNFAVVFTNNGDVTLRNAGDLNVGTVTSTLGSFGGIQTATTKTLSLTSDTGVITQSGTASDFIITGELQLNTTNKNATLTNAANQIVSLGNSSLGSGKLTLVDGDAGLSVTGTVVANGGVNLTTQTLLSVPAGLTVGNGDIVLAAAGGSISVDGSLSATSGQVELDAGSGTISQTAGSITAQSLIARGTGDVALTQTTNDVATVAGSSTGGTFRYTDATAISIGSLIDASAVTVNGITTSSQDITVTAGNGGVSGGIAVDQTVNAGTGGTVRLQSGTGDLTQTASGAITAGTLLAVSTDGMVDLRSAANLLQGAGGTSGVIAGSAATSFLFQNSKALTVSATAVAGDGVVAAATGVTANLGAGATARVADLSVTSGDIAINGPVSSIGGMIAYRRTGGTGSISVSRVVGGEKLIAIDLTGAAASDVYGTTPGTMLGGMFTGPTPATGTSPLTGTYGVLTGGAITLAGSLDLSTQTTYLFGTSASYSATSSISFGLLGAYGFGNGGALTGSVRAIDPTTPHDIQAAMSEPAVGGIDAAYYVRRDDPAIGMTFNGIRGGERPPPSVSATVADSFTDFFSRLANPDSGGASNLFAVLFSDGSPFDPTNRANEDGGSE
jgi:filamentous hemagglutinin family protein